MATTSARVGLMGPMGVCAVGTCLATTGLICVWLQVYDLWKSALAAKEKKIAEEPSAGENPI